MQIFRPVDPFVILLFLICLFPFKMKAQQERCLAGSSRLSAAPFFQVKQAGEEITATPSTSLTDRSVITIPVVVHVVWNKNEENISNEQILSQIDALNEDFRAKNVEIPGIPSVFQDKIADVEIEFCLAAKDPSGNATTGITRTYTDNSVGIGGTTNVYYTSMGGKNAWNPEKYLNIWVVKFAGGVGGTSSFPGVGLAAEDGVQINYLQFGTFNVEPPYHLGRTCTHEIGHYFNLEHVWGPSFNSCCNADDFVADTPNSCANYLDQCPTHPVVSCSEPDMFMNYMFYTDDDCMGMFTNGQKARMLAALNTMRTGLLTSDGCGLVAAGEAQVQTKLQVFQNPAREQLDFLVQTNRSGSWRASLSDLTGRTVFAKIFPANERQQFLVENVPAGLYFLVCSNGSYAVQQKIVISR